MEQRLITIYMTTLVDEDRGVQEHLDEYLQDGWRVVAITPIGSAGDGDELAAWFAVLLQREGGPSGHLTVRPSIRYVLRCMALASKAPGRGRRALPAASHGVQ